VNLTHYVRLTYQHTYRADGDALELAAAGGEPLRVGGFTRADLRLLDVTDPAAPQEVAATVTPEEGGYALAATARVWPRA
jgi:hypothetical protein